MQLNKWIIVVFILSGLQSYAQTYAGEHKSEVGLGLTNVPRFITEKVFDATWKGVENDLQRFVITYKKHLGNRMAYRFGVTPRYLFEKGRTVFDIGINAGIQGAGNQGSDRLGLIYGLDIVAYYGQTESLYKGGYIGIGPVIGLPYRFTDRFTIITEAAGFGAISHSRYTTSAGTDKKTEGIYGFHRFFSIHLNYHF